MQGFLQSSPARAVVLVGALLGCMVAVSPSGAEVRAVTATGEYRMGDNDTRADAKRLALLDAKRLALEQVGTYIESMTLIKNFALTKEEIREYTAGIVEVVEHNTKDIMEGSTHIIQVEVSAKIDSDVVVRQIDALRQNESVKAELLKLGVERDRLTQEVAAKTRELAALKSKSAIEAASEQRKRLLARVDIYDLLRRGLTALQGAGLIRAELEKIPMRGAILKKLMEQVGAEELNRITPGSGDKVRESLDQSANLQEDLRAMWLEATKAAHQLADQALQLDSSEHLAHSLMGSVLLEEGNPIAAVQEYRTAVRLAPHEEVFQGLAHCDLAMALKASGDLPAAVEEFRTAVRVSPERAIFHLSLGQALQDSGDLKGAIVAYRTAVRLEPNWSTAHMALSEALEKAGDLAGAIREYRIRIQLEPDNRLVGTANHSRIAEALAKMGDLEGAVIEMRSAVPGLRDAPLAVYVGLRLQKQGDRAGAIAAFRMAVRLEPGSPEYHYALAEALGWADDHSGAIQEFRAALRIKPDYAQAHAGLALALTTAGDHNGAIREARSALRLEPANGGAHFALGNALLAKGEKEAAAEELREYLRLASPDKRDGSERTRIRDAEATLHKLGR